MFLANQVQAPAAARSVVLGVCCVSILLVGIDMTAVNVALPAISADFHTGAAALSWTIDGFTLVLASFLMFSASLADRYGRKRVFRIGLAVFTVASLLCAVAPNAGALIAFRMIQALGGSMLNPVAMSIISNVFPERAERAKAIGVWAGVTGMALALGPVVGGALVSSPLGWRWIFVINIPIGLIAMYVTQRVVPESKAEHPRRFDPLGQLFVVTLLASLTYGIIEGPRLGWTSLETIAIFALALAALAGILIYEPRRYEPLLELRFYRSIPFAAANAIAIVAFAALGSFLYLNSIYLQDARGFSALTTGLLMLPLAIVSLIWGPLNGHLLARVGARIPFVLAGAGFVVSGIILALTTTSTPIVVLLLAYAAMGFANAAVGTPITHTTVSGWPPAQAGVAAGINSTVRQVGQTIGIAIAGATLAATPITLHEPQLVSATHTGWWLVAGYGVAVVILGIIGTTSFAKETARRVARATVSDR
jgi:EmrB/QacA subfamily drug resistance transporter